MIPVIPMLVAAAQVTSSPTAQKQQGSAICRFGAVYKTLGSGKTIIVKRFGTGSNSFQANGAGPKQAGMALDFVLTDGGDRGAIYGPMRSHMFAVDLSTLKRLGYRWEPAHPDPDGFFRVLSDDGQSELFTFTYVACARGELAP
jgi:hypothetical protein